MSWDEYIRAKSVDEALDNLDRLHGAGRVLAGGTDLILQLQAGQKKAHCLLDVSSLSSLCGITHENGRISIGAATTHSQIGNSSLLFTNAPLLSEACSQIGSPQIRNIGTVGGNIVNAQPAADSVIGLLALDATCTIVSKDGVRNMPVSTLFSGPGISAVDSTQEILTEISFDAASSSAGSAFYRLSRRKAGSLPVLNCAVYLHYNNEENTITRLRIAMGPVAPTPIRLYETERVFTSDTFSMRLMKEALNKVFDEVNPRSSLRGGREYRNEMAKVLVKRAVLKALQIAGWKDSE